MSSFPLSFTGLKSDMSSSFSASSGGRSPLLVFWSGHPGCALLDGHGAKVQEEGPHRGDPSLLHGSPLCLYPFRPVFTVCSNEGCTINYLLINYAHAVCMHEYINYALLNINYLQSGTILFEYLLFSYLYLVLLFELCSRPLP